MAALRMKKVDVWAAEEPTAAFLLAENSDLQIFPCRLEQSAFASVFAKDEAGEALCSQYSEFVNGLRSDGTLAEIKEIWFGGDEARRTVLNYEALPDTNGTLHMAVDTSILPFAYVKDNRVVGYDVDIAARFCQAYGYRLETVPMDFGGILPSVEAGKCDFAGCAITVTEERAESVLFSAPTYDGGTVLVVRSEEAVSPSPTGRFSSLSQLDGQRIGVQTGTAYDELVMAALPNARISYFNSYPDMAAAMEANKIDGFPGDEPVIRLMVSENDRLTVLNDRMDSFEFGFIVPKSEAGEKLLHQLDAWIADM